MAAIGIRKCTYHPAWAWTVPILTAASIPASYISSMAIAATVRAMEEMYEAGMEVAVRMGTVMSMQDDMLGHFLIPIAAMRREGTSQSYVDLSYPAVADIDLVNAMNETVTKMGKGSLNGLNCTMDGFCSNMHDSRFSLEWGRDMYNLKK